MVIECIPFIYTLDARQLFELYVKRNLRAQDGWRVTAVKREDKTLQTDYEREDSWATITGGRHNKQKRHCGLARRLLSSYRELLASG